MKTNTTRRQSPSISQIEAFWDKNPLFSGESEHPPGSAGFFRDHRDVYIADVFAKRYPRNRFIPSFGPGCKILDVGCGAGFWTAEIARRNPRSEIHAVDLTTNAVELTRKRLELSKLSASVTKANAENLPFDDGTFDHVNCQGVVHHTPNPTLALKELARVTKPGGSVFFSVYYRNIFLVLWPLLSLLGRMFAFLGAGLTGRGRENIMREKRPEEIVRQYDGAENPLGIAFSKQRIVQMLPTNTETTAIFLNYFPARALPIPFPNAVHFFLSRKFGFMIHVCCLRRDES